MGTKANSKSINKKKVEQEDEGNMQFQNLRPFPFNPPSHVRGSTTPGATKRGSTDS